MSKNSSNFAPTPKTNSSSLIKTITTTLETQSQPITSATTLFNDTLLKSSKNHKKKTLNQKNVFTLIMLMTACFQTTQFRNKSLKKMNKKILRSTIFVNPTQLLKRISWESLMDLSKLAWSVSTARPFTKFKLTKTAFSGSEKNIQIWVNCEEKSTSWTALLLWRPSLWACCKILGDRASGTRWPKKRFNSEWWKTMKT